MTRFRMDEVVDLGDGWFRAMRPGEELFEVTITLPGGGFTGALSRWVEERRLGELAARCGADDMSRLISINSMVVPRRRPKAPGMALDPRQLALPLAGAR